MTPLLLCYKRGIIELCMARGEGSHPQTCVGLLGTSQPCCTTASSPKEHKDSFSPLADSLELAQLKGTTELQTMSVFEVGRI